MKKFKELSKKQKLFMLPLFAILLIGSVFAAGYLVSTLTLNVGVKEAFEVEYAILGDGQHDYAGEDCPSADYYQASVIEESIGFEGDTILPGQERLVCVRITNYAGELPYTIDATMVGGDGTNTTWNDECNDAFVYTLPEPGITVADSGTEPGITYDWFEVIVAGDAPVVNGCKAVITVARG